MRVITFLMVAAGLAVTPIHAVETPPDSTRLFVGKTNIYCVMAPCPWRGIGPADALPASPAGLLWSEQTLPPLVASAEDTDRIIAAWNGDECLIVDGGFIDGQLRVEAIEGPCV